MFKTLLFSHCLWAISLLGFTSSVSACDLTNVVWRSLGTTEQVLKGCQRPLTPDEDWLYTWGHKTKFELLFEHDYEIFSYFNDANQFAFSGYKARTAMYGYDIGPDGTLDKNFIELLDRINKAHKELSVGELAQLRFPINSAGTETLAQLAANKHREILTKLAISTYKEGDVDLEKSKIPDLINTVLRALAFDRIYPGFIADFDLELDEMLRDYKEKLKDESLKLTERLDYEGAILGLTRVNNTDYEGNKKPTNLTVGVGLYLSNNPYRYLSHYYDDQHTGYACRTAGIDSISDLNTGQATLIQNGFYFAENNTAGSTEPPRKASYPLGVNDLTAPRDFRYASQKKLIKTDQVYLDVGAISYKNPNRCRKIELDDFQNCEAVTAFVLFQKNHSAKGYSLFESVTSEETNVKQNQVATLVSRLSQCASEANQGTAATSAAINKNPCPILKDANFLASPFAKENKTAIDNINKNHCT